MPTATAFVWDFPWTKFVGVWNAIMQMFDAPIALATAIGVAVLIASIAIGWFRSRRGRA